MLETREEDNWVLDSLIEVLKTVAAETIKICQLKEGQIGNVYVLKAARCISSALDVKFI